MAAWRKCLRKIWRVHPMTQLQPNGDWYSTNIFKFVADIFQNCTPVFKTIVSTTLNNPLSVFAATIIPSLVTVIWIVWKSGPTCTMTGSPHCLWIWYAMLMPRICVMVHMYLFFPLMKREILVTTFVWIEILHLFIMSHFLSYTLDIWPFYLSQFNSIHRDSMCFYLSICN